LFEFVVGGSLGDLFDFDWGRHLLGGVGQGRALKIVSEVGNELLG